MPITMLIAASALGLALPMAAWALVIGRTPAVPGVRTNLLRGLEPPSAEQDQVAPSGLAAVARAVSTPATIARLERLLGRAGRPPAWPLERLVVAKFVLGAAGATLGLLYVSSAPSGSRIVLAVLLTVVAWAIPDLMTYSRGKERQAAITLELPDMLDQMTIAVQAGLGFESAMARAGRGGNGPLAEEFIRTLQDIQLGQQRRDAYQALAARTTVPDLRRFLRAVTQADAYGVSITGVLTVQAAEMRLKRRMRAEEKAMQIPVKVIFPLIVCILPTLFIVLLGPAALDIIRTFSG